MKPSCSLSMFFGAIACLYLAGGVHQLVLIYNWPLAWLRDGAVSVSAMACSVLLGIGIQRLGDRSVLVLFVLLVVGALFGAGWVARGWAP